MKAGEWAVSLIHFYLQPTRFRVLYDNTIYHLATALQIVVMPNMTKTDFIFGYFGTNRYIFSAFTDLSNYVIS